jgi:hypothetical protein
VKGRKVVEKYRWNDKENDVFVERVILTLSILTR